MIVFHGSPNYFNKFKDDKIGTARDYNLIQGHYFSEDMNVALNYKRKYYYDNRFNFVFLQDIKQPISGYLYVCEVPDKSELLDLSQKITDAPESVKIAISNILKDPAFKSIYIKIRANNTIREFITYYTDYCRIGKIQSMISNIFYGYKGVYYKPDNKTQSRPEIVIFDAKDIQIKQCFIITQVRSNINVNSEYNKSDIVTVLFKRFNDYYYATGVNHKAHGIIIFSTDKDCPEIINNVQTFDELDQNQFVIAYIISKPVYGFSVIEANINSLNYKPQSNIKPTKQSIYTVGDIKAILNYSMEVYAPVKSKILNPTEFAEYKKQADSYKYMRQNNSFTINAACDCLRIFEVNTLLLQRAEKPYFNLHHISHTEAKKRLEYLQERKGILKPKTIYEKQESEYKLTDEQIQEKTKEFLKVLKPIIKERIKTLYNLPDETEKQ